MYEAHSKGLKANDSSQSESLALAPNRDLEPRQIAEASARSDRTDMHKELQGSEGGCAEAVFGQLQEG